MFKSLRTAVLALVVVFVFSIPSYAGSTEKILTMEDSGSEIELRPGEKIILQLEDPGSTGFGWYTDELDESHLKLIREEFANPFTPQKFKGGKVPLGGGGVDIWTFKAVAPGDTILRLLEYQVWIGKEHAINKFELKLHIAGTSVNSNVLDPYDEIKKEFSGAKTGGSLDIYNNGGEGSVGHNAIITVELKVQGETGADWYVDGLDESRLKLIGIRSLTVSPKIVAGGVLVKKWYLKPLRQVM